MDIFELQEIRAHIPKDTKPIQKVNQKLKKFYVKFAEETIDPRWQFFTNFEDWVKDKYEDRDSWFEEFCKEYYLDGRQHFEDQMFLIEEMYKEQLFEENQRRKKRAQQKLNKYVRKTGKLYF